MSEKVWLRTCLALLAVAGILAFLVGGDLVWNSMRRPAGGLMAFAFGLVIAVAVVGGILFHLQGATPKGRRLALAALAVFDLVAGVVAVPVIRDVGEVFNPDCRRYAFDRRLVRDAFEGSIAELAPVPHRPGLTIADLERSQLEVEETFQWGGRVWRVEGEHLPVNYIESEGATEIGSVEVVFPRYAKERRARRAWGNPHRRRDNLEFWVDEGAHVRAAWRDVEDVYDNECAYAVSGRIRIESTLEFEPWVADNQALLGLEPQQLSARTGMLVPFERKDHATRQARLPPPSMGMAATQVEIHLDSSGKVGGWQLYLACDIPRIDETISACEELERVLEPALEDAHGSRMFRGDGYRLLAGFRPGFEPDWE